MPTKNSGESDIESRMTNMEKTLKTMLHELTELKKNGESKNKSYSFEKNGKKTPRPMSQKTCYKCGRRGHINRYCELSKLSQKQHQKPKNAESENKKTASHRSKLSLLSTDEKNSVFNKLGISHQKNEAGMFIIAVMNDQHVKLLLDTGATISILGTHVYEKINPSLELDVPANDVLCASGTKLQVRGKTTVALTLETDLTLHQQMPVADLQVDGALGLDFMKNHPCVIDVCNNHLKVGESLCSLFYVEKIDCYRVTFNEHLNVPPRTEIVTIDHVDIPDYNSYIPFLEQTQEKFKGEDQLLLGRTLVNADKLVTIRLLSLSDDIKHIYPGTIVGRMNPIDSIMSTTENQNSYEDLTPFLKVLFGKTVKNLDNEQAILV